MLNGRVRNGNGCGHPGMVTGKTLGNDERGMMNPTSRAPVSGLAIGSDKSRSLFSLHDPWLVFRGGIDHAAWKRANQEKDQCGQAFGC